MLRNGSIIAIVFLVGIFADRFGLDSDTIKLVCAVLDYQRMRNIQKVDFVGLLRQKNYC